MGDIMAYRHFLALMFPALLAGAESNRVDQLRIRILSTMLSDYVGVGEWGFSAVVETPQKRILFDTGMRPETVLHNAQELKVALSDIDDVVLSHNHGDHTGGLVTLRRELLKARPGALARAWVGQGIFDSMPSVKGAPGPAGPYSGLEGLEWNRLLVARPEYESLGGAFVIVDKPREIAPGVWLTGPVPRKYAERNFPAGVRRKTAAGLVDDIVAEDMSLVVDTPRGLVILTGCGHAGIINTIAYAREKIRDTPVYAVVGGMHLFDLSDEKLDWTAEQLKTFGVQQILGAHCTGVESAIRLRQRLGLSRAAAPVGAVGTVFDLQKGIKAAAFSQ
jgi:7,8-dihydropterin-6-yl-methyl-4-(beta-D-ribofuranosyl)aminobenzene 5'-phosphate synthase